MSKSHFTRWRYFGSLKGYRKPVARFGSKASGLEAILGTRKERVLVRLFHIDGKESVTIWKLTGDGKKVHYSLLWEGELQ